MVKLLVKLSKLVLLLLFTQGVKAVYHAQEVVSDTIHIESVSIHHRKNVNGFRPGQSVLSVDNEAINEKRVLTLAELLQENSPIFIKAYGRGSTATASFRGTGSSHTGVYWNGLRINSPMSGEADFSLIPIYFVDEVAIHIGQSSMNVGTGGLGGAVSLVSKPDWTKSFGGAVFQSLGSFNTYSTAAFLTYGKDNLRGQTRFFREYSENNFSYINRAEIEKPIETQKNADFIKYGLLQEVFYRPTHNSMLSAKIWAQINDKGVPKLMSNTSKNELNRQLDNTLNAIFEWRNTTEKGTWRISSGMSIIDFNFKSFKTSPDINPNPEIDAFGNSRALYNRGSYETTIFPWLTTNFHGEINSYWVKSDEEVMGVGYKGQQLQGVLRFVANVYPTKNFSFSLLVSEEVYDNIATPITTSLTLEYVFATSLPIVANGGASRNINYPSLNDMYWQPGGNPSLKPEDGLLCEIGVAISNSLVEPLFNFGVNLFYSNYNNWILWLPHFKGFWEPVNISMVKSRGAELSVGLNKDFNSFRLKFSGNYNFTKSTIEDAGGIMNPEAHGRQLPFVPLHSGGCLIGFSWREINILYTFTHYSERLTTTSSNPGIFGSVFDYYMSNLSIRRDITFHKSLVGIQFRVENLLNENYETILFRPMPGRNYTISASIEF